MWTEMSDYGWGWMMFGGLHMLLFWAVIILAIVALVRWLRDAGNASTSPSHKTALQLLQERYARGEVDREEYLRIKTDLAP